jgi:hypothetical protein
MDNLAVRAARAGGPAALRASSHRARPRPHARPCAARHARRGLRAPVARAADAPPHRPHRRAAPAAGALPAHARGAVRRRPAPRPRAPPAPSRSSRECAGGHPVAGVTETVADNQACLRCAAAKRDAASARTAALHRCFARRAPRSARCTRLATRETTCASGSRVRAHAGARASIRADQRTLCRGGRRVLWGLRAGRRHLRLLGAWHVHGLAAAAARDEPQAVSAWCRRRRAPRGLSAVHVRPCSGCTPPTARWWSSPCSG